MTVHRIQFVIVKNGEIITCDKTGKRYEITDEKSEIIGNKMFFTKSAYDKLAKSILLK